MPSRLLWSRSSNRSQASGGAGSSSEHLPQADPFEQAESLDPRFPDSSRLHQTPDRPPSQGLSGYHLRERPTIDTATLAYQGNQQGRSYHQHSASDSFPPTPLEAFNQSVQQPPEKRSLRSRLGLGHSHKEGGSSDPAAGSSGLGLGRSVSFRRKGSVGAGKPGQRASEQINRRSTFGLKVGTATSPSAANEQQNDYDPYLSFQEENTVSTLGRSPSTVSGLSPEAPQDEHFRAPNLDRVNSGSYYSSRSSVDHSYHSSQQHPGYSGTSPQDTQTQAPIANQPLQTAPHPQQLDPSYQAFRPPLGGGQLPPQQSQTTEIAGYNQRVQPQGPQQGIPARAFGTALAQQEQNLHLEPPGNPSQQDQRPPSLEIQQPRRQGQFDDRPLPPPPPLEIKRPEQNRTVTQVQQQEPNRYLLPHQTSSLQKFEQSTTHYDSQSSEDNLNSHLAGSMPQLQRGLRSQEGRKTGSIARDVSNLSLHQQQQSITSGPPTPGFPGTGPNTPGQGGPLGQQLRTAPDSELGRGTTPPGGSSLGDMSDDDFRALKQEHKELKEKYTKVKKYYFEKEAQVHALQNTLAHQRLTLSRTSLDDSEYAARFARLDGLASQLAFSIRKSWRAIPPWLQRGVNKDALTMGKQEMTAVGRAFLSRVLVDELFDKYFHPDLELNLSTRLKQIQHDIRFYAASPAQTAEEEEALCSKIINWRLATVEGLTEHLRHPSAAENRQRLVDTTQTILGDALKAYQTDPPPSDIDGGVYMIAELAVNIAVHIPLESRDVTIAYAHPGTTFNPDTMKLETGIPALSNPVAANSATGAGGDDSESDGDGADAPNRDSTEIHEPQGAKDTSTRRGMFGGIMGGGGGGSSSNSGGGATLKKPVPGSAQAQQREREQQQQKLGAGGSQVSLTQSVGLPGGGAATSGGGAAGGGGGSAGKEDAPQKVRMSAGISLAVRGRNVLAKAPVYTM